MKNTFRSIVLAACVLAAAGCAQLGLPGAKTFVDKAVAAQLTSTAVRRSAIQLLDAGRITPADARNAQAAADAARQGIDLATAVYVAACPRIPQTEEVDKSCSAPAADAKLTAAISILTAVQTYLDTKAPK